MHIYTPNTRRSYQVGQVNTWYEHSGQTISSRTTFTVNKRDGAAALAKQATQLLRLAETDEGVKAALGLVQAADPGWGAVYDVLKFVEGTAVAHNRKTKIKKYRGTASWYRHLGEPKRPALPADPPTLAQAREYAFGLLQEWLDLRLKP